MKANKFNKIMHVHIQGEKYKVSPLVFLIRCNVLCPIDVSALVLYFSRN